MALVDCDFPLPNCGLCAGRQRLFRSDAHGHAAARCMRCSGCRRCGSIVARDRICPVCGDRERARKARSLIEAVPMDEGVFRVMDSAGATMLWRLSREVRFCATSAARPLTRTSSKVLRRTDGLWAVHLIDRWPPRSPPLLGETMADACIACRLEFRREEACVSLSDKSD